MQKIGNLTVEDAINNSGLSKVMQEHMTDFIVFIKDSGFSVEMEDDKNGWKIVYMNEVVAHINFVNVGIWVVTCDFGESAEDDLKAAAWAHVRNCEHFSTNGKQCGCGSQPGFNKMIFGKEHKNLCFAHLEFINPDAEALEHVKKLMLLYIQNA